MAKKLAHYEDLEEQGRLVVLPEGFDREMLKRIVADEYCPSYFGLKDTNREAGKCIGNDCKECWEKALKGE